MTFAPRDQMSEVVDTKRRFTPEWYTWLQEFVTFVAPLECTVAQLPSPTSVGVGARRFVTDSTSVTFLAVVAGGGSNKVPVVSDGTSWLIG